MSTTATSLGSVANAPDADMTHEQQQRLRNEAGQREEAAAASKASNNNNNNADGSDVDVDEDEIPLRDMRDDSDDDDNNEKKGAEDRHDSATTTTTTTTTMTDASRPHPACAQCGRPVPQAKPPQTINGPLHPGCVWEYKFLHQPRCHYCDIRFRDHEATEFVKDPHTGALYHRVCARLVAEGVPYARPTRAGYVRKLAIARSKFTRKNWKVRFFALAPSNETTGAAAGAVGGIRYYVSDPSGKAARPKNSALTPAAGGGDDEPRTSDNDNASNNNSSSDNDDDDDAGGAEAAERRAKEEARLTKGYVRLDARSRLITQPSLSLYRGSATATPTHTELAIVFYDSADSKMERRLLFQCADARERQAWLRALEAYIHTVDDPADYKKKKPATSDKAVEQAAAQATQAEE